MQRILFRPALDETQAELFSSALVSAGALSASIEDADAGTSLESARYAEPAPVSGAACDLPGPGAWKRNRVVALVDACADIAALVAQAAAEAGMAAPEYSVEALEDQDWVRATQAQFAPIAIGQRLWIVPSWREPPAEPQAVVVRLDPGRAFGTGSHPSTRLALAWLEAAFAPPAVSGRARWSVLDYGCGSGILAIAAVLLGAGRVDAVDLDRQALEAAADNARSNQAAVRVMPPESLPEGDYDIVLANILSRPLIVLAPLLGERVRPGGRIVLSGILEAHAGEVIAAYAPRVALHVGATDEGWVLLEGRRPRVSRAASRMRSPP